MRSLVMAALSLALYADRTVAAGQAMADCLKLTRSSSVSSPNGRPRGANMAFIRRARKLRNKARAKR